MSPRFRAISGTLNKSESWLTEVRAGTREAMVERWMRSLAEDGGGTAYDPQISARSAGNQHHRGLGLTSRSTRAVTRSSIAVGRTPADA
jgi:hypothetical protein